jgi:thiol-disulfide isomerase/thioredoxin
MRVLATLLLSAWICAAAIVADVRAALADDNFKKAESILQQFRKQNGATPEWIEAYSWLGRGALARKRYDQAEAYAAETRRLCMEALKKRKLDDEPRLPIALGASIEVQGQLLAGRGQRSEGVSFLQKELAAWKETSMRARIQKNIHLLSLVGQTPPPLEISEWLGPKPQSLSSLHGKAVLLFFWAHWCPDCKYQAPILAQLRDKYGPKGLIIVGPTQRYGYTARGEDATPQQEKVYIDQIRKEHYAGLAEMPVPLSEENFKMWGCSSTPTLVLLDRKGLVRMYHPGKMTYEELATPIEDALR